MSSIFGWSYPFGCSGPPDYYDEIPQPRCHCGAFVSAAATDYDEVWEEESDMSNSKPNIVEGPNCVLVSLERRDGPWDEPGEKSWWEWVVRYKARYPATVCKKCGSRVSLER